MMIEIKRAISAEEQQRLGVEQWPIWEHEAAQFPWQYDAEEICYLLSGEVTVIAENGESFEFKKGDLVTFPKGLACEWIIHQAVKKHYHFRN